MNSKPRGIRGGRPPERLEPAAETWLERLAGGIDAEGEPMLTLEEIAARMQERFPRVNSTGTPRPWTAGAARSALGSVRRQRLTLLLRVGSLLEAVEQSGWMDAKEFADLSARHQVSAYWLWDRYQSDVVLEELADSLDLDVCSGYLQPIAFDSNRGDVWVDQRGLEVLRLYRDVTAWAPGVASVAGYLRAPTSAMTRPSLRRVARYFGVAFDDVAASGLIAPTGGGRYGLTERGEAVAESWSLSAMEPEEEGRWDAGYFPTSSEVRALRSGWDWDDRPLMPPLQLVGAPSDWRLDLERKRPSQRSRRR